MRTFSVKNFERFQHYKDRAPPWIKFYNELLDDYEFGRLPDASKWHLVAIWLLASRSDNKIPYDPEWVARRINASSPVNLDELAAANFILVVQPLRTPEHDASTPIAERLSRERGEGETQEEEKKETNNAREEVSRETDLIEPTPPIDDPIDADELDPPAFLDRQHYTPDFEALWAAYRPIAPKNATKADASRAFGRLSVADRTACHAGVEAYVRWLLAERGKRPDAPAKHLATFIHKRGWEPFIEVAAASGAASASVWITEDDPRWPEASKHYQASKGRPPIATGSRNGTGIGFHFPADVLTQTEGVGR